ncbi:hypothetical protein E3N88_18651 [Mikania micrantha]|uniref:Retroviral polymerase SH3-like domain-containing protein n=1 Tax=Mikania micrantha TaxID=192012 RepID=A0A5N6NNF6_9ASTR|nr:hypothetical protein E3N88_18651 [Mikania micrantha]
MAVAEQIKRELIYVNEELVFRANYDSHNDGQCMWYLDMRATNHMTGKGSMLLEFKNRDQRLLTDILYILYLKAISLALDKLKKEAYDTKFPQSDSVQGCISTRTGLCRPITPATEAGNRNVLLFVDNHSRFMWPFMLKAKDEALLNQFKAFKAYAENQHRRKMKVPRTDQGGEFTSKELPTRRLQDKTSYEALKGRKPRLNHLQVFGCVGHGYRMYDVNGSRVVISKDVVFEERRKWEWNQRQREDQTTGEFLIHIDQF